MSRKGLLFDLVDVFFGKPKKRRRSNTPSRYRTVTGLSYGTRKK